MYEVNYIETIPTAQQFVDTIGKIIYYEKPQVNQEILVKIYKTLYALYPNIAIMINDIKGIKNDRLIALRFPSTFSQEHH